LGTAVPSGAKRRRKLNPKYQAPVELGTVSVAAKTTSLTLTRNIDARAIRSAPAPVSRCLPGDSSLGLKLPNHVLSSWCAQARNKGMPEMTTSDLIELFSNITVEHSRHARLGAYKCSQFHARHRPDTELRRQTRRESHLPILPPDIRLGNWDAFDVNDALGHNLYIHS
jgi:hypothetical protein